jgi:tetratricopeptide (TPR) repeat protein
MNIKDRNKTQKKLKTQQNKLTIESSKNNQNKFIWFALATIFLTTYIIYYNAIKFDFLITWDDNLYIIQNIDITNLHWLNIKLFFTKFYANNYQPITMLFYAIEYKVGGGNASIFHINNILLHIINTYLVFVFIRKISPKSILVAIITAAFFAIHPMHVESVAWIAERKDVLYSFFFLLSLIIYSNFLKSGKLKHLIFTGIFFLFSCLSKSAAVILPLVMLLLDYYTNRKYNWKMILEKIPFFAISLLIGLFALKSQDNSIKDMAPNMSFIEHVLIISFSFISYIFKAFIPVNLSAFYPYPLELGSTLPIIYYISILCVVSLLFFVWYSFRWDKNVIFGFLFFTISIILVIQIFPVGAAIMADRYTYIPYIGLFFIIGNVFEYFYTNVNVNYKKYKNYLLILLIFGFIVFSSISYGRVKLWKNDDIFFSEIINQYPYLSTAYKNRGSYYLGYYAQTVYNYDNTQRKMYIEKATKDFENSLKYSVKNTDKAIAYNNIGIAKSSLGDFDGAIQYYSKSIAIDSLWSKSYSDRGSCYINYYANKMYVNNNIEKEKYIKKAIIDFEGFLKYSLTPMDKVTTYYDLGCAKFELNDFVGSINCFDKAIKIDSNYSNAYNNRGSAKNILKDYIGAIKDFNKVIELNPQNAIAYFNRGLNKYVISDYNSAIKDLNMAITIDENLAIAYYIRGNTKQKLKKYESALEDYNIAIKLNPQDANSIKNRDIVKSILENK